MCGYLHRMWTCRFFWLSLVRNDLRARYRRSLLGIGWSLVRPIVLTIILCVVFHRLFRRADAWSYAPYLLSGLIAWDYLVTATKQGCQCFFQGESYIRQHPTPAAIFPLRIALTETFHFLVAFAVLFGFTRFLQLPLSAAAALSLLPTLLLYLLLAWSLACLAGFANVYFQDTQHLCDVGFQVLFYATPIIYAPADLGGGRLSWIVEHCNPMSPILRLLREPLLHGQVPSASTYAAGLLTTAVVFGVAGLLCSRLQRRLIFQL